MVSINSLALSSMLGAACLFGVTGCMNDKMDDSSMMKTDGMSKDDMMKKGDEMVMKGQSMKDDAMTMKDGEMKMGMSKSDMMMKGEKMMKDGMMMKEKAMALPAHGMTK